VQPELLDTGHLQRNIEALLFVASEALSIKQLAKLTGAEESDVSLAIQKIEEEFAHRGLVVRFVAGGYRFASAPAAREVVEAYLLPPKSNLSPAALETLAIVAYTQPTTKGEIEEIRGVSADSVIATLVDRRFLTESGRRDSPGRPMLYKTTAEFLEAFGLNSLEDLPPMDVDANSPIELALPISTISARHQTTETEAGSELEVGEGPDEDLTEPRAEEATSVGTEGVPTDDRESEQDEQHSSAPVETTAAEPETEPTPSAV
jgi:segregation and condensation protein B